MAEATFGCASSIGGTVGILMVLCIGVAALLLAKKKSTEN